MLEVQMVQVVFRYVLNIAITEIVLNQIFVNVIPDLVVQLVQNVSFCYCYGIKLTETRLPPLNEVLLRNKELQI